jgi:hypothetical protein
MDVAEVKDQLLLMSLRPITARPLLTVELTRGIILKGVVLHSIEWFKIKGVTHGGWLTFMGPDTQTPLIQYVDFDDIFEVKVLDA